MAIPFEPVGEGPNQHNWDLLSRQFPLGPQSLSDSARGIAVYKTLLAASANFGGGTTSAVRGFSANGSSQAGGANTTSPILLVYLNDSDYALAGKSTKLRVAGQVLTNATAPTVNFTFALHEVTAVAGAAGGLTYTIAAATTGSTGTVTTPALSTRSHIESADFAFPADGFYCLGVENSGTTAANSFEMLTAQLQIRHT